MNYQSPPGIFRQQSDSKLPYKGQTLEDTLLAALARAALSYSVGALNSQVHFQIGRLQRSRRSSEQAPSSNAVRHGT